MWGGLSGLGWSIGYIHYFVPLCYLICLFYTIVGVLITRRISIHSIRWWKTTILCYAGFLIVTGIGSYLTTGRAFYDGEVIAIIDVWLAPLLWLGEVEIYLLLAHRWRDKVLVRKLWLGTQNWFKWALIQYFTYAIISFLICDGHIVFSLVGNGGPAYNFDTGLIPAILVTSFLFAFWHSFFPEKRHWWTYIIPWAVIIIMGYLEEVYERGWYYQVITIDDYMLGMWLAPVFGALTQCVWLGVEWISGQIVMRIRHQYI